LNNNFELYFNDDLTDSYKLTVKVYYNVFAEDQLQDTVSGFLSFPIMTSVILKTALFETMPCDCCFEFEKNTKIYIFDISNKFILRIENININKLLQNLSEGFYLMICSNQDKSCFRKIILKK
jgi:hypothetical protein